MYPNSKPSFPIIVRDELKKKTKKERTKGKSSKLRMRLEAVENN